MKSSEHLEWLRIEGDRFARTLEHGPLDTPIPTCPGWTLADLGRHVGSVHRWAAAAAREGRQPPQPAPPTDDQPLADWYRAGLAELLDVLGDAEDQAPTWHPFPAPPEVGVWKRRQAQEIIVHRWDAQRALGGTVDPIDPALASDGVDEFFGMVVPRIVRREEAATPAASLHLHCTDVPGEWLVWTDDSGYQFRRVHAKGDAALRGPAADLLLWAHRRTDVTGDMEVIGDTDAVTAWASFPGF